MELPHIGKHCNKKDCNRLDFLPIKCDACHETFCEQHYSYDSHNCRNAYQKNNQVPVCPLCNNPVPVGRDQHPDVVVSAHIDNDCQSDPAKSRRKVFTNKCSVRKCKTKEVVPVVCPECALNYCFKHRHPTDHQCQGRATINNRWNMKFGSCDYRKEVHGNISDDEALARALALSMQDTNGSNSGNYARKRQEELDLALARQLQASETQTTTGPTRNTSRSGQDRCNVS